MYKEKEYNKLTNQIRQDFNTKIKSYYIKDKCKLCGSINDLELHHMIPLSQVVNDIYKLDYDNDIKRIFAIGKQIDNGFITVCHDCHKNHPVISEIHGHRISTALSNKYKAIREDREKEMNEKLYDFLPNNTGKRIYPDDIEKQQLIEYCNQLDNQHRLQRSFYIIKKFIDNNTDYMLRRGRDYSKKDIKLFGKTYWIIENKPNTSD